jgi:UDP-glucose 4-epimerase
VAAGAQIVVTGARGYVGGRLVERLTASGRDVLGTSRGSAPPPRGWPSRARLLQLDPNDPPEGIAPVLAGAECVVHLAAANENRSAEDPDAAVVETGIAGRHVLEAAIMARVRRFILVSTIRVYGWPLRGRLSETALARPDPPLRHQPPPVGGLRARGPRSGPDRRRRGRLSNVIGAPAWLDIDRWTLLGNDLAQQAVRDGRMTVRTPNEWREFITLYDTCAGLHALVDAPSAVLGDGLFNLGGACFLRRFEVAERVADAAEPLLGHRPAIALGRAGPRRRALPVRVPPGPHRPGGLHAERRRPPPGGAERAGGDARESADRRSRTGETSPASPARRPLDPTPGALRAVGAGRPAAEIGVP